ncbi:MAG: protein disulfide oxidoreductase [Gammaproteobacteria bacterium]|nr:protein disulfide oxidoreductase [Gammaproteobacteria bacterium]
MAENSVAPRSPKYRRWLRDALLLVAVVVAVHVYQTRHAVSGLAPPLAGIDVRGQAVDLAALRGRPVLVHFWATWCPVCRAEQGSIAAIARDWTVIGIALEDTQPVALRAYMDKAGLNFPTLRDAQGEWAHAYGVRAVPTTFVIDAAGHVRFTEVGYTTEPGLRLRLWLADIWPAWKS